MTTSVQRRRGTTAQHSTFTGLEGEITVDTTKDTAVVHDGSTAGGFPLAREDLSNISVPSLTSITGSSTASDDLFIIYDSSTNSLKKITRDELNNAIEQDALANVTITGGSINGTTIGASTASSGAFTSLSASGAFSANGGVTLGDASGDALTINSSAVSIPNGLNFDSNTFVIDATNNRAYIGASSLGLTTTASVPLFMVGQMLAGASNTTANTNKDFRIAGGAYTNNAATIINFSGQSTDNNINYGGGTGAGEPATQHLWYTGTVGTAGSGTERMRITSAGNVGIGTSSPTASLHVAVASGASTAARQFLQASGSAAAATFMRITNTGGDGVFGVADSGGTAIIPGGTAYATQIYTVNSTPLQFGTNSSVKATLDSSGNLGLGVTPSAWGGSFKAYQNGGATGVLNFSGSNASGLVSVNAYNNGTSWLYQNNGVASRFDYNYSAGGAFAWNTAPSGTAGNAITFTQAMTLDASGNFMIGTTSPLGTASGRGTITLNGSSTVLLNMAVGGTRRGYLYSDSADNTILGSNGAILFEPANTEKARIDSSGNLLVGTTSGSNSRFVKDTTGLVLQVFNSNSSTGASVMDLNTANTGSTSSYFVRCGDASAYRFYVYTNGNTVNFNNSYGAISDIKLKENIVDATPKLEQLCQVKVRNYNLIGQETKQIGVIAQELEEIFPSMVEETQDRDSEGNVLETTTKSVKYSVFVPMLIKALQEQQAIITDLKARIEQLESK